MKKTPSRERMIERGPIINDSTEKISTVTTKQDRLPNSGMVKYVKERYDAKGVVYTDKRLLTPMETYKLMGFGEKEYLQAKDILISIAKKRNLKKDVSAREKLYKQAGNSIVVNVLEMIFYYMEKINKEL
jgi:DNA (cytosine-5)-methyltransferase 1